MEEVKGFRIGDRVRATWEPIYGMTGTVIGFDESCFRNDPCPMLIIVEFDERNSRFHNAGGKGKEEHCYKLYPDNIEKLGGEKSAEEPIKIGDRVVVEGNHNYLWANGMIGTVIVESAPLFGIEFDEERSDFHSCDGRGKAGYCFWIKKSTVTKLTGEKNYMSPGEALRVPKEKFHVGDKVVISKWITGFDKTVIGRKALVSGDCSELTCYVDIPGTDYKYAKMFHNQLERVSEFTKQTSEPEKKKAEEKTRTESGDKYKVGDRVFYKGRYFSGKATVIYAYYNGDYCVRMDDRSLGWRVNEIDETYRKRGLEVGGGYWNADADDLTLLAEMPKTDRSPRTIVIRITDDGAEAKYMNGKTVEKTAEIKRYHEDKPDDEAAAVYAIAKLFGGTARKKNEFEVSAEWASTTADILRGMDWNDILFKAFAEKK